MDINKTSPGTMPRLADCRQKAILPPFGGRIALSANERIAEFLDFAIQAKFAYVNKLTEGVQRQKQSSKKEKGEGL